MKKEIEVKWYDNANIITTLIIALICGIIIISQSFAINGDNSLALFTSIINHNSSYLLIFIYFLFLKTKFGKKYFNYLNLFLMFIYLLLSITSLLTVIQSFSLDTVLKFIINLVVLLYTTHTMFRDTRVWKDYNLGDSPFNELSNEWYLNTIIILGVLSLAVSLISTVEISGVILSLLDFCYIVLLSKYVFLYRQYLDDKKIDSDNEGNFDGIKENIKDGIEDVTNDLKEFVNKYELDDKVKDVSEKIVDTTKEVSEKAKDFIEKNDIDEKIVEIKDKVVKTTKEVDEKKKNIIKDDSEDIKKKKRRNRKTNTTDKGSDK